MTRLTTQLIISAMLRRVHDAGGSAMVLAKGDATAGGILVLALEKGGNPRFFERGLGPEGLPKLIQSGPQTTDNEEESTAYWRRRRARDPDLWVVELDIAAG